MEFLKKNIFSSFEYKSLSCEATEQVQPDKSLRQIGLGRRFLHVHRESLELCTTNGAPELLS